MHFSPMVRRRMVELAEDEGMSTEEIASVIGASESGVRRVLHRNRERGTYLPLPRNPGRKLQMTDAIAGQVRRFVAARPDVTWQEIKNAVVPLPVNQLNIRYIIGRCTAVVVVAGGRAHR